MYLYLYIFHKTPNFYMYFTMYGMFMKNLNQKEIYENNYSKRV